MKWMKKSNLWELFLMFWRQNWFWCDWRLERFALSRQRSNYRRYMSWWCRRRWSVRTWRREQERRLISRYRRSFIFSRRFNWWQLLFFSHFFIRTWGWKRTIRLCSFTHLKPNTTKRCISRTVDGRWWWFSCLMKFSWCWLRSNRREFNLNIQVTLVNLFLTTNTK